MICSHSSALQKMVPHQWEGDKTCGPPLARGEKPDFVMHIEIGNTHMRCYMCQDYQHVGSATVNFASEDVSHHQ